MTNSERIAQIFFTFYQSHSVLDDYVDYMTSQVGSDLEQVRQLNEKMQVLDASDRVEFNVEGRSKPISLDAFDQTALRNAMTLLQRSREMFPGIVMETALVYLVARFEAFLNDLLIVALIAEPRALKSSKQMPFERIIDAHLSGRMIEELAEDCVGALGYESFSERCQFLADTFGVDLQRSDADLSSVVEMYSRRNIILHNGGIVNKKYLKVVTTSQYQVGDQLKVDIAYWKECLQSLMSVSDYLCRELSPKVRCVAAIDRYLQLIKDRLHSHGDPLELRDTDVS